jgi:hypothetical protein
LSVPLRCIPGAEIDHRFLLLDRLEGFSQRLQGAQPHVVVERVELLGARIGRCCIGRGGLTRLVRRRGARIDGIEGGAVGGREPCQRCAHPLLAAREIGQHLQARVDGSDRDQIGRRHPLVHPLCGFVDGLLHIFGLHGARVEYQRQQPVAGGLVGSERMGQRVAGHRG